MRRSAGMLAWSFGNIWSEPQWRVQVYWPEVKLTTTEIHVVCRTVFRLLWRADAKGCGIQVFGFGFGVAWDAPGVLKGSAFAASLTGKE
jgi:hypothetical protein